MQLRACDRRATCWCKWRGGRMIARQTSGRARRSRALRLSSALERLISGQHRSIRSSPPDVVQTLCSFWTVGLPILSKKSLSALPNCDVQPGPTSFGDFTSSLQRRRRTPACAASTACSIICANRHLQDGMHIASQPINSKVGENDRLR
jgi:hypothetical protein